MDRVLHVERFDQCREVVGVGVQIVAIPRRLERPWPQASWAMQPVAALEAR